MAVGEMDKAEFTGFLDSAFHSCARHSRPGAIVYACMDWRHIQELQSSALASSLESVNLCVWVKPNGGMGSFYRSQHELVFVFKNGPGPHINNVELGKHGRNRTNVWSYASGPGFGRAGEEGRLAALHRRELSHDLFQTSHTRRSCRLGRSWIGRSRQGR
jgi:hypothetical protein